MHVEIDSRQYPNLLKEINQPPEKLYYKGNWDAAIFKKCLTVVGARKMTTYGREITRSLVKEIANAGITIVSGFMYGVDATAHKAALEAGARTIAVMPCGIEIIHPQHQQGLYQEILENNGLVISELEGSFPPRLWTYPRRNRIMAGLSLATLVMEASLKSGSLITAKLAQNYKRKVFAVPGPLTSSASAGTLQLIKEGAAMVTTAQDILREYELESVEPRLNTFEFLGLNKLEQSIVENLGQEPMEIDVLSRRAGVSVSEMGITLSLMQLKGLLSESDGKYYVN